MKKLILTLALFGTIFGMKAQIWNSSSSTTDSGLIHRAGDIGITSNNNSSIGFNLGSKFSYDISGTTYQVANYGMTRSSNKVNLSAWDGVNFFAGSTPSNPLGPRMAIKRNGNVEIGTATPDLNFLLTVNGKILCEEVEVVLDVSAADYVFEKYFLGYSNLKTDYVMPTLEEVEAFIKANHHLPEVPSAATIKEEGLQLKQMTNLLLQKVEELTLYTIEQEKRIIALEAKLAEKE